MGAGCALSLADARFRIFCQTFPRKRGWRRPTVSFCRSTSQRGRRGASQRRGSTSQRRWSTPQWGWWPTTHEHESSIRKCQSAKPGFDPSDPTFPTLVTCAHQWRRSTFSRRCGERVERLSSSPRKWKFRKKPQLQYQCPSEYTGWQYQFSRIDRRASICQAGDGHVGRRSTKFRGSESTGWRKCHPASARTKFPST